MSKSGKIKVVIPPEYDLSEKRRKCLQVFISYCVRALDIEGDYTGQFVVDRHKHGVKTTAVSMPQSGDFLVYVKGRAFVDILRSIAHELVHVHQYENDPDGHYEIVDVHFSSDHEDEANMIAGQILNAFTEVVGYDIVYEGRHANRTKAVGTRRDLG